MSEYVSGHDNSLSQAVDDIGSNDTTLYVDVATTVSDDLTVPANIHLRVHKGAVITVSSTNTLSINGALSAGEYEIFAGAGDVTLGGLSGGIKAEWFPGSDIGEKINNAIASISINTVMPVSVAAASWCGQSYSTMIAVDKPAHIIFPGIRAGQATYTGTTASLKCTTNGVHITGFSVNHTGNANSNVDGLLLSAASDCIIDGGINLQNLVRHGIYLENACYHNQFNGIIRIDTFGGDAIRHDGTTGKPTANVYDHVVLCAAPASGQNINLVKGSSNSFRSVYIQSGNPNSWAIVTGTDSNHMEVVTIDSDQPNGIKIDGTGNLHINWLLNNASGTKISETSAGRVYFTTLVAAYPWTAVARERYSFENSVNSFVTAGTPSIYSSGGGGTGLFSYYGNLVISGSTSAGAPRDIALVTGSTPAARKTLSRYGAEYYNSVITFGDGDATPEVSGGNVFKTANTQATTITNFDFGFEGQTICTVFGDSNTTIDFTGTNLLGNGGADWSPINGDHMTCTKVGNYWYCDVSDNTI